MNRVKVLEKCCFLVDNMIKLEKAMIHPLMEIKQLMNEQGEIELNNQHLARRLFTQNIQLNIK